MSTNDATRRKRSLNLLRWIDGQDETTEKYVGTIRYVLSKDYYEGSSLHPSTNFCPFPSSSLSNCIDDYWERKSPWDIRIHLLEMKTQTNHSVGHSWVRDWLPLLLDVASLAQRLNVSDHHLESPWRIQISSFGLRHEPCRAHPSTSSDSRLFLPSILQHLGGLERLSQPRVK